MKKPAIFRKRLIPEECILLKDDVLLYCDAKLLITSWNTLKPKKDLDHGISCYFLNQGYKISKFYNHEGTLISWYCDIIDYTYDPDSDTYVVTDLLADVILYPDGFVKVVDLDELAEAFEKRLEAAMDSFMFRIHIASGEFQMEEPQGQNRFFDRCAEYLLELSDELERNLYIEAIVKEYHKYGITTENLRKRVNSLALRSTPAERRTVPKSSEPAGKKKENAADKAQKLMLTWLVTYPGIFETVEKYLTPSDFVVPLYKEVADMLWNQRKEGEVNPARLLNAFTDSEEQREVASLFNATIHLETKEEQEKAFSDALLRIKQESLAEKNKSWDPTDMGALQELIQAKKELEELGRKRQQLHISFE